MGLFTNSNEGIASTRQIQALSGQIDILQKITETHQNKLEILIDSIELSREMGEVVDSHESRIEHLEQLKENNEKRFELLGKMIDELIKEQDNIKQALSNLASEVGKALDSHEEKIKMLMKKNNLS